MVMFSILTSTIGTLHRCDRVCYGTGGDSNWRHPCWRCHPPTLLETHRHLTVSTSRRKDSLGTSGGLRRPRLTAPRERSSLHHTGPHRCGDPLPLLQPDRHVRQVRLPLHPSQGWGGGVQDADGHRGTG